MVADIHSDEISLKLLFTNSLGIRRIMDVFDSVSSLIEFASAVESIVPSVHDLAEAFTLQNGTVETVLHGILGF
jgi:uncharacterized protein with PhoU and TrkA domain